MSRITGTTSAQTTFLRAFRTSPGGPPPDQWPSPAILRRWLRRPTFARALASVRDTLRIQTDFHLASAATLASATLAGPNPPESAPAVHRLSNLLRLAHLRDRFASESAQADEPDSNDTDNEDDDSEDTDDDDEILEEYDIRNLKPHQRVTKEEFRELANYYHYSPPLIEYPTLPVPTPSDSPYYKILSDSSALLWFLQLYDQAGNDHRFSPILLNCRHLLPREDPSTLPRLVPGPQSPSPHR